MKKHNTIIFGILLSTAVLAPIITITAINIDHLKTSNKLIKKINYLIEKDIYKYNEQ